jgi:hypothetical protein
MTFNFSGDGDLDSFRAISLLSRFFRRRRSFVDSRHATWVEVFCLPLPKPADLQGIPAAMRSDIVRGEFRPFTHQDLSEVQDSDERANDEFLIEVLALNRPIDPLSWHVWLRLLELPSDLFFSTKLWKLIWPYIARFLLKLAYQLTILFENPAGFSVVDASLLQNASSFIPFLSRFSLWDLPLAAESIGACESILDRFVSDTELFMTNKPFSNFVDALFAASTSFLTPAQTISFQVNRVINLCVHYFESHSHTFRVGNLSPLNVQFLAHVIEMAHKLEDAYLVGAADQFVRPLVVGAARIFAGIGAIPVPVPSLRLEVVALGTSILHMFNLIADRNPSLKLANYARIDNLGSFVLFALDTFPLSALPLEMDLHSSNFLSLSEVDSAPVFCDAPTFDAPVEAVSQYQDFGILMDSPDHLFDTDPRIASLFRELIRLFDRRLDPASIKAFTSECLTIIFKLIECDPKFSIFQTTKHCLPLAFHFFFVSLCIQLNPAELSIALAAIPSGWCILFHPFFYGSKLLTATPSPYVALVKKNRTVAEILALVCFQAVGNEDENPLSVAAHPLVIVIALRHLLSNAGPELFEQMIPFILRLFQCDPGRFVLFAGHAGLTEIFSLAMTDFQVRHITCEDDLSKQTIARSRLRLFTFFDMMVVNPGAHAWLLSQSYFVNAVFRLLFEASVRGYALNLLKTALLLTGSPAPKKIVLARLISFLLEATANMGDIHWIDLTDVLLRTFSEPFSKNKDYLFPDVQSQQLLSVIARIPAAVIDANHATFSIVETGGVASDFEDVDENTPQYQLLLSVLDIFQGVLCGAKPSFQESVIVTHGCLRRIGEALSRIRFGLRIVDQLIFLVVEESISLTRPPPNAQIRNFLALSLLLNATAHLSGQEHIYRFLISLASSSASNRLRLFQADVPNIVIDLLNRYPDHSHSLLATGLSQGLHLFSIVSQHVFSLPTLFRCLQAMRPRPNGDRLWWTSQLVSLFSTYIEDSVRRSPPAFFYLDGRNTGFELPPIPPQLVRSGWSFMCRCEPHWASEAIVPLLEIRFDRFSSLEILWKRTQIRVLYVTDKPSKSWEEVIQSKYVASDDWVDIIFSSDAILFLSKSGVADISCVKLRPKTDFNRPFESVRVGYHSSSDSSMGANMTFFYFFSGKQTQESVKLLTSLPLSFLFGFSQSEYKLDRDLPAALFTGEYENRLFFGANARVTDGQTCFNLSRNGLVGNATFRGYAFPFSTSFVDITNYAGGVMLFLPLFQQVNSAVFAGPDKSDNRSFFMQVLSLFRNFFSSSPALAVEFARADGFKAMAAALVKIAPEHYARTVLCQLGAVWDSLAEGEDQDAMLVDIWLNFELWTRLRDDAQAFVYGSLLPNVYGSVPELFASKIQISHLCALLASQQNPVLREPLWMILQQRARRQLTVPEQDVILSMSLVNDVPLQTDALFWLNELTKPPESNLSAVFGRHGFFDPFLGLLRSPVELVRLHALSIIFLIYEKLDAFSPQDFELAIVSAISHLNGENVTSRTWSFLLSLATSGSELVSNARFAFPLLAATSHFVEPETAAALIEQLLRMISERPDSAAFLAAANPWYFWVFYLMLQAHAAPFQVGPTDPAVVLVAQICCHAEPGEISACLCFCESLSRTHRWQVFPFVQGVCRCILQFATRPALAQTIFFEVVRMLFFISPEDPLASNLELLTRYSIAPIGPALTEFAGRTPLAAFLHSSFATTPASCVFSIRSTATGQWADLAFAESAIRFFIAQSANITAMPKLPRARPSELFTYAVVLALHQKATASGLDTILVQFAAFFAERPPEPTAARLFLWGAVRLARTQPRFAPLLQRFVADFAELRQFSVDFGNPVALARAQGDLGLDAALWLDGLGACAPSVCEAAAQNIAEYNHAIAVIRRAFEASTYAVQPGALTAAVTDILAKQRRDRSIAAKTLRRFERQLAIDGGAWATGAPPSHWRLWARTDVYFRHVYLRPNRNFNNHQGAALKRDIAMSSEARLEYQRWIEEQQDGPEEDVIDIVPARESEMHVDATLITMAFVYRGSFHLSKTQICFDGVQASEEHVFSIEGKAAKTIQFQLSEIVWVLHRSYLHLDKGLEFFVRSGRSYFFFFGNGERGSILSFLIRLKLPQTPLIQQTDSAKIFAEQKFTEHWVGRLITTYHYLMLVNLFAGRSFNDLSQYPVFPWILADYTSSELDLTKPEVFRDLSKPIGALNPRRLSSLHRLSLECDDEVPCLYRSHYSTPYNVLLYLIRLEPCTTMHTKMQAGKFDHPNRLFGSIQHAYETVTGNAKDFRELIPEFFTLPDFLVNKDGFNLGLPNPDVELPAWAPSPADFIAKHRHALECDHVSQNLNGWLDLVFGFKQRGRMALESDNTFHPFSYDTCMTKSALLNPELLSEIQHHAGSFGIIPRRLFTAPHPSRSPASPKSQTLRHSILAQSPADVVCLGVGRQSVFYVAADSVLREVKLRGKDTQSYVIPFPIGVAHSCALFPDFNRFVFTAPSRDAFHAFSLEPPLTHLFSFRQQFSLLSRLIADRSILAVFSQDGSLLVWDFRSENHDPVYRSYHHFAPGAALGASDCLRVIATCDVSNRVVFADLYSGAFMRAFQIADDRVPIAIHMLNEGFLVAVCEQRLENGFRTIVQVHGLGTEMHGVWERKEKVACSCAVDRIHAAAMVAVAFEDGLFVLLGMPGAAVVASVDFASPLRTMVYDAGTDRLLMANADRQILATEIDY